MPETTLVDTLVTVLIDCTLLVMVVQGGLEVTVDVWVTVGMRSRLLQNGVATFWACMMVTIASTALQLRFRSSIGDARADAAKSAGRM